MFILSFNFRPNSVTLAHYIILAMKWQVMLRANSNEVYLHKKVRTRPILFCETYTEK